MMNKDRLMMFGGGILSVDHGNLEANLLNDFFMFSNKSRIWRMIHTTNMPSKRRHSAMCQLGDLIVLYGGDVRDRGLNDLWIFDTNQLKGKYRKARKCKHCRITRGERRLYVCKKCRKTRYCSKKCQKKHWKKHKTKCL